MSFKAFSTLSPRRAVWFTFGAVCFGVGLLGILLPLLPTTIFMILAAFAFGRSSPELEARMLASPMFGPAIRRWRESRSIARQHKIAASLAMAVAFALSVIFRVGPVILGLEAICLIAVALFLWSRPEPDAP